MRVCVLLFAATWVCARSAHGGDAFAPDVQRQRKMTTLSIRIARAEGNEGKLRKYKSFARQQRIGKNPRFPFLTTPGTRVLRPGRTP